MNKYVVRTSFVWIIVLVIVVGALVYHSRFAGHRAASAATQSPGSVTPAAAGPAATPENAPPAQNAQAPRAPIQLTPQRMQSIGVTTGMVEFKSINNDIRATGNVDTDQRLISYVQIRFPGYIRQVFANAIYQYVHKNEPLFTIYSPELVATQQEYLLARQNQKALSASTVDGVASGAAALAIAAERRLAQWEVPQSELNKLKATGKPITDLTVNSPVSGYITEYNALPNMYVQPSTRLYTVADLSQVWVYAQVFQDDVGRLKPGDRAQITVDAYPNEVFSGRVDQILPQVDLATRTVRVRLVIANFGLKLKPGMFVNVDLKAPLGRALVVPASAVLQSGIRQLVFLYHGDGKIEPKEVSLGPSTAEGFVVLKGLKAHQRIVTSANFLIDSESQLQAAAGSFVPPAPGSGGVAATQIHQAVINFTTNPNPPHKGENTFLVKLIAPNGSAITGAKITITFYMPAMPAMGMGAMNTTSTLSDKGSGSYEGTSSLGSGGTWQVTIVAQKNGQNIATRQLRMSAKGGM